MTLVIYFRADEKNNFISSLATKEQEEKKILAVVMRRNVAGLTPTLQIVHWASCLIVE